MGIAARTFALVSMIAVGIAAGVAISPGPALCAGQWTATGQTTVAAAVVPQPNAQTSPDAQASPAAQKSLRKRVKAVLQKVNPMRLLRDREYQKASAEFPDFCKDWGRKLHDREVNNQNHIAFQEKDGWETASYTGYGPVQKCECHQSKDGYSIGKVTYDEFRYYLVGKTTDDAKHATPKVTDSTATTELFRWDKEKWFY
jgi:hypothetical protein